MSMTPPGSTLRFESKKDYPADWGLHSKSHIQRGRLTTQTDSGLGSSFLFSCLACGGRLLNSLPREKELDGGGVAPMNRPRTRSPFAPTLARVVTAVVCRVFARSHALPPRRRYRPRMWPNGRRAVTVLRRRKPAFSNIVEVSGIPDFGEIDNRGKYPNGRG